MILFVDANAIVANPLLRGRQWDSIGDAASTGAVTLLGPELAVIEAVARYRRAEGVRQRALRKELRHWPRPSRDHLSSAIEAASSFSDDYERVLRERLDKLHVEVMGYPDVDHKVIAERAVGRVAPFDEEGNGYRDTLHWFTFLQALEEREAHDPFAFLLSGDKGAFGPRRHAELKAEVQRENSEWTVSFVPRVMDFVVPGQFFEEEMELDRAQERELLDAVAGALLVGGHPTDFTSLLADMEHFDEAFVTTVGWLTFGPVDVRMERGSRDLWVQFTAEAACDVNFESVEVLDDEAGDFAVLRDTRELTLELRGTAYLNSEGTAEVADIRLESVLLNPLSSGRVE